MKWIPIKMTKCILYLTEKEMQDLLKSNMDLWAESIQRGKAFTRAEQRKDRDQEKATESILR